MLVGHDSKLDKLYVDLETIAPSVMRSMDPNALAFHSGQNQLYIALAWHASKLVHCALRGA